MKYSVVIPLKDEEDNIAPLIDEVEAAMAPLGELWELICIDDGSLDSTPEVLLDRACKKSYLRILTFDRNYGQTSAFDAGFHAAKGEFVITLDGDGQNAPYDIPKLLEMAAGYDLVCGVRVERQDTSLKRWISRMANAVRSRVCQDGVRDTGCSLKVYRKKCLDRVRLYEGMHRFLPALFQIEGFSVAQVPVNHRERKRGKTKYNLMNRSLNTVFDLFAVFWMRKRKLRYKIRA